MASALQSVADALPLTYAFDGLERAGSGGLGDDFAVDITVLLGAALLALVLGAATLRRRTA
jgi:ABC-2 type transport system permease protein